MSRGDIIVKEQDLTYLTWDECSSPSGLGGSRPKAREGRGPNAVYYKRSRSGVLGEGSRDLLAELIGARLAEVLGFEHVPFQLVCAKLDEDKAPIWIAKSKSYRKSAERAVGLEDYIELAAIPRESPIGLMSRMGWRAQAAQIVFFDYLTATRDRDASSFEVLLGPEGASRLSPIAPRSLSLVNSFPLGLWRRDPLADLSKESFLAFPSQEESLEFVARALGPLAKPRSLKRSLLGNLGDSFGSEAAFLEGCFEIINARWDAYARICDL